MPAALAACAHCASEAQKQRFAPQLGNVASIFTDSQGGGQIRLSVALQ